MDHDSPDIGADSIKLYLQEEGLTALNRIRTKILSTAALTAAATTIWATATNRRVSRLVPALTANSAVAMAAFAVCQEGVRAVRHGEADAWNSFCAGGLAGAALTRLAYGRGFHLLGAVVWAPLCGSIHWANSQLQPTAAVKGWLAKHDLLDAPAYQQQTQQAAEAAAAAAADEQEQQEPKVPIRFEDMPWREKILAVEAVKQRELQHLHSLLREEEQARQQQEQELARQQQQQLEAPRRKGWLW